jgi:two-component system OmpR family response regulator
VLLIGGYWPLVKALKQALEEEGFGVDVACDGYEGNRKVHARRYEAVVIDRKHPREPGPPWLQRWRRAGFPLKVLELTVPGGADESGRCGERDAATRLTKPFALDDFLARVRALVRRTPSFPGLFPDTSA